MKMIVKIPVVLITAHRPVSILTLGPGTYDCWKGKPPEGYNPSGGDWVYHKEQMTGVTFGANAQCLKGVEFVD